jgi:hypothetical protein
MQVEERRRQFSILHSEFCISTWPRLLRGFLRRLIRWRGFRFAGEEPVPAPASTFRKGVNVLFARTVEIQKVHAHVLAGLADAEVTHYALGSVVLERVLKPFSGQTKTPTAALCVLPFAVSPLRLVLSFHPFRVGVAAGRFAGRPEPALGRAFQKGFEKGRCNSHGWNLHRFFAVG